MPQPANPCIPPDEVWIEHKDAKGELDGMIVIPNTAPSRILRPEDDHSTLAAWQILYPDAWFRPADDPLVQAHWAWKDAHVAQLRANLDVDKEER